MPYRDLYLATVYDQGALTTVHTSVDDAFVWVKDRVEQGGRERGVVKLGDMVLVEYTPSTTRWYADGYQRWEAERERQA